MPPLPKRPLSCVPLRVCLVCSPAAPQAPTAVQRYDSVFAQLRTMAPQAAGAASVHNVTLRRDAIVLRLEEGILLPTTPVAGRTVGAVFVGRGVASFVPPLAIERAELKRVLGDTMIDAPITAAVLLFTDSTRAELDRALTPASGASAADAAEVLRSALDVLLDEDGRIVTQSTLMEDLLNGAAGGFFYAHVKRARGKDLMLKLDPAQPEAVSLLRPGPSTGPKTQVIAQFRRAGPLDDTTGAVGGALDPLQLASYRIESTIANGLNFSAAATVRFTARRDGIRWAPFRLYTELQVDSVVEATGAVDSFFRAKHSPELWIRLDPATRAGETRELRVRYHGDLIGFGSLMSQFLPARITRLGLPPIMDNWLFVKESQTWFPRYGNGQAASFDLVFHAPRRYLLASIGRLASSQADGDVATTHWVMEQPTDQGASIWASSGRSRSPTLASRR